MRTKKSVNILVYFGLIITTILTLFPLLWGISASFRSDTELYQYALPFNINTLIPVKFTGEAYIRIFTEFNFLQPIINTLIVTIISIILGCIINSIAAFAFAWFDFKLKGPLFVLIVLSFMIPFEAIALPLYTVVDKFNLVNTRQGMIVPGIANGLVLFLFIQFFKGIPSSLIEAARVDGASLMVIFWKIIIPLSLPVFITAGLMIFMEQWN